MREHLTGDDLYAYFLTLRVIDDRAYLVAEDDNDCVILDKAIDPSSCLSIPGYGKESVNRAMQIALDQGLHDRILAVLDRDWVGYGIEPHPSSSVLYTERHDLDAELLLLEGLTERVAAPYCNRSHFISERLVDGQTPLEWVIRACSPLGVLRRMSVLNGLSLRLRQFPLHEYVSVPSGPDLHRLCDVAIRRSPDASVGLSSLEDALRRELESVDEPAEYCAGHDLAAALSLLVDRHWQGSAGRGQIERTLRAVSDRGLLERTSILDAIRVWEASRGVRVLVA